MSARFLEFTQNFYDASLSEIADAAGRQQCQGSFEQLETLLRPSEFVALYREQVRDTPPTLPALAPGELRPVFGRAGQSVLGYAPDASNLQRTTLDAEAALRAMFGLFSTSESRELKSALLYAHSCLLIDPFARRPAMDPDVFVSLEHPYLGNWGHFPELRLVMLDHRLDIGERLYAFSDVLRALAVVEDLIADGTLVLVTPPDPHALYFGDEQALTHTIVTNFYFMGLSPRPRGGPDERVIAEILKLRAKEQILGLLAYGDYSSVFAGGGLDELALDVVLDEMMRSQSISPTFVTRTQEDRRLTRMAELNLPGVDNLAARYMVDVRRHDLFEAFRDDVRDGLRTADEESDLESAREGFGSEMRSAAQRLGRGVSTRDRLEEALGGDALGWAIGALGGWNIDGWRGSILGLAAGAAYEYRRARPNPGSQGLRNHYIALS